MKFKVKATDGTKYIVLHFDSVEGVYLLASTNDSSLVSIEKSELLNNFKFAGLLL